MPASIFQTSTGTYHLFVRGIWLAIVLTGSLLAEPKDRLSLELPKPQEPAESLGSGADLFQPFASLPGPPGLDADLSPEVRLMLEQALAETEELAAEQSRIQPAARTGEQAPPEPADPPDPELLKVATVVAPRAVGLRAWDGYGEELGRGCGFFVTAGGEILADFSLVRPNIARRIEYITVQTAFGARYRVTGFRWQDAVSGLVLLTTNAENTPFLKLSSKVDFSKETPVRIVSFEKSGSLILADARALVDQTKTGAGWIALRGEDAPGEPGSPIVDSEGNVVGVVSMAVRQKKWYNFAVAAPLALQTLGKALAAPVKPLAKLEATFSDPAVQDERFLTAFTNLYDGRTSLAVADLLNLRLAYPRSAPVWALLGLACTKLKRPEEALRCNLRAAALDPEVGQYWFQLGMSQANLRDEAGIEATEDAMRRAVAQQPTNRVAWTLLAERQIVGRKYTEAEKSLLQAIKLRPDSVRSLYLLAYTRGRMGKYDGAENAIKQCLKLDRKNTTANFYHSLLCAKQGRLEDAVNALKVAVDADPNFLPGWKNLAAMNRRLGKTTEAALADERVQRIRASRQKP